MRERGARHCAGSSSRVRPQACEASARRRSVACRFCARHPMGCSALPVELDFVPEFGTGFRSFAVRLDSSPATSLSRERLQLPCCTCVVRARAPRLAPMGYGVVHDAATAVGRNVAAEASNGRFSGPAFRDPVRTLVGGLGVVKGFADGVSNAIRNVPRVTPIEMSLWWMVAVGGQCAVVDRSWGVEGGVVRDASRRDGDS